MADGLSSNMVTDMVQDGDGYLWIATVDGLNRYDGTEIRTFYAHPTEQHALPDNYISRLILIDSFHLAIATMEGLSILDTRRLKFHNIFFSLHDLHLPESNQPEARLSEDEKKLWEAHHNVMLCMEKDASGNLWLGTRASLLCLDKQLRLTRVFYRHVQPNDLYGRRLRYVWKIIPSAALKGILVLLNPSFVEDSFTTQAHRSWFLCHSDSAQMIPIYQLQVPDLHFLNRLHYENQCFQVYDHYLLYVSPTHDSLYLIDEYTHRKAICHFLNSKIWNGNHLIPWLEQISELHDGWMVFAYQTQGLSFMKLQDERNNLSLEFYPKVYLPQHSFRKIFVDREGNIWLATEMEGLFKISPDKQSFESIALEKGSQRHEVATIYRYGNQLWIANYGNGLYRFDLKTQKIAHFLFTSSRNLALNQLRNMVWNVRHERGDTFWIGTQMGLIWYNMKNNHSGTLLLPHPGLLDTVPITTQFTDSRGWVWMGLGLGHGLCIYDPHQRKFHVYPNRSGGYPFRYPTGIAEDENGDIWLVNDDVGSLVHWNRITRQFTVVTPNLLKGRLGAATGAICMDHQHSIWYAVDPFGVIRYDPSTREAILYGPGQGLNEGTVRSMMNDGHHIWLASAQGISCFDVVHQKFTHFTEADGLPTSYFTGASYKDTVTQQVYMGVLGGIILFNPAQLNRRKLPLSVNITGVFINNKFSHEIQTMPLRVPYRYNDIAIFFTGVNLTDGKDNEYAYRLDEGKRKKGMWMNIGHQRQIRLANLSPGVYHLSIKGARRGEEWSSNMAQLDFIIIRPFTRSAWFYLLLTCGALAMIYGWYRYRMQQLVKLESIRSQISHDLHDEIGSHLTTISLTALLAKEKLLQHDPGQPHLRNQIIDLLMRISNDSHLISETMREIVWTINPRNDSFTHVFPYLIRYGSHILECSNIEVEAIIPELHDFKMNVYEKRDLILIFKEAIHNIVKHSSATHVKIALENKHDLFSLLIIDNGKGFDPERITLGNGLQNMKERALQHNWLLEIHSSPDIGTRVIVHFRSA